MRWRSLAVVGFFCLIAGLTSAPAQAASKTHVACDTSDLLTKIAAANSAANRDVLVLAHRCTYVLTSAVGSDAIDITSDLSIVGNGSMLLRNATAQFRVLGVFSATHVVISHLTVAGGHAPNGAAPGPNPGQSGGGIANAGTLTLKSVIVTGNVAGGGTSDAGGAVGAGGGSGGGISNAGTLRIVGSKITSNHAGDGSLGAFVSGPGGNGGGIDNSGSLTMIRTTLANNSAGSGGGSAMTGGFGGAGGGLHIGTTAPTKISHSSIVGDRAGTSGSGGVVSTGGGVRNDGPQITPRSTVIRRNTPDNCAPSGSVRHCHG